jgi:hypothetical protein
VSFRLSVTHSINDCTRCRIFLKFGLGVVYKKKIVVHACFLLNQLSDDDTLLKGDNEIYLTFYIFRPIWIKFDIGSVHKQLIGHCELPEKRRERTDSRTLDGNVREFPYVLSGLGSVPYRRSAQNGVQRLVEFRESR